MGRQEDDKSDKNPVVTIRDARPTDQAQLRRAVVEIQEYERKLHNTRLPGEQIADAYLAWADPYHWIALAWRDGTTVGVVTVTTMLYVEWGRLGEIGDLYVLPKARRSGVGTALVDVAKAACRDLGCSAVSVTITPEGEARHRLTSFYRRLGFTASGRSIVTHILT